MSIKEKIDYVWNVLLGPDYEGDTDIENTTDPDKQELRDSLTIRVKALENNLTTSSTSNKSGKGGKSGKVVEIVIIDQEAIQKAVKDSKSKVEPEKEEKIR